MADGHSPQAQSRHPGAVRAWVAWWVVLGALWIALVDQVALAELLVGAAAVSIGATGAVLVRRQREMLLRPRARWALVALRTVPSLATDLVPLARALWRRGVLGRDEPGAIVDLPYAAFEQTREHAAHRALTEALGSLGPNTVVVDLDEEHGVLRAHQLVPSSDPAAAAEPLGEAP